MKTYTVELTLTCLYTDIEASSKAMAVEKALEWFAECQPDIEIWEEKEDDE